MDSLILIYDSEWNQRSQNEFTWILMDSSEDRSTFTLKVTGPTIMNKTLPVDKTIVKELNITLYAGPNVIGEHHETGLVVGDNTVTFNLMIEEDTIIDWNGDQFNPEVRVKMKLRGNRQSGGFLGLQQSGEPAKFEMSMGEQSYIELPIDDDSWNEAFQDGGDIGGSGSEDAPGFTLVVASAAIAMAVFVNTRRDEE